MRIKFSCLTELILLFITVVLVCYAFYAYCTFNEVQKSSVQLFTTLPTNSPIKHVSKLVTVIIRDFEQQENDVAATVQSILNYFSNVAIYVLYDTRPYPPLQLNNSFKNVKEVNLSPILKVPQVERLPLLEIKTKYVVFIPDSVRINSKQQMHAMLSEISRELNSVVVASVQSSLQCLRINVNLREWVVKYSAIKGNICDAISGKHLLMMETEQLRKLAEPFQMPIPLSIYLQTAPLLIKARILKNISFQAGKPLLRSHHAQTLSQQAHAQRLRHLYRLFRIKQAVRPSGAVEWYGCTRDSARCFPPVQARTPSYLHEARWTPPCCLANLRRTARHALAHLAESGVRHWLEAGSLLGAMRAGALLPWAHDVDVGLNGDDVARSALLQRAQARPTVDAHGFLWEKAIEGNFYRVHFSKANRVHVNLLPFRARNGTMRADGWVMHRRMEFPDNFLHPMSSIEFVGRQVPAPNNIRDFLELKYGKGAIEMPEYANPSILPFP